MSFNASSIFEISLHKFCIYYLGNTNKNLLSLSGMVFMSIYKMENYNIVFEY